MSAEEALVEDVNSQAELGVTRSGIEEEAVEEPIVLLNRCVVCDKTEAAYKCPACYRKYCSVSCCKTHKTDCNPLDKPEVRVDVEDKAPTTERHYYFPTKDTVPVEKLQMLSQGQNLVDLKKFCENPEIRSNILKLDTCSDPISAFNEIMEDESFVQFSAFVTNALSKD
jgi:hypothetical protein